MKKRIIALCSAVVLLVTALAACGDGGKTDESTTTAAQKTSAEADGGDTDKAPKADGEPVVLGGLAPLTGAVSVYGISCNNGTEMAVEEINAAGGIDGRQIEYHVLDEQGDVTEATNAYARLVSEYNIDALIGDVTSKPSISVAQRANKDGMPMIAPTATADAVTAQGENVFRTCFTDASKAKPWRPTLLKTARNRLRFCTTTATIIRLL